MANVITEAQTVIQGTGVVVMARLRLTDANYITQAAITSVTQKVFHRGTQVGNDNVLSKTTVVFDTLQTDDLWDKDSTGYNLKVVMLDTELPDGDKVYDVWFYFVMASIPKHKFHVTVHTIDDPSE